MKLKILSTLLSMTICSLCGPLASANETKSKPSPSAKTVEKKRATGTKFNPEATRRNGGSDPGGGGGQRVNGVLKTLPEVGYIFERAYKASPAMKEYPDYYDVKEETKAELRKLISEIGVENLSVEYVFDMILGDRDTLIAQPNIMPADYDLIKKDYRKVVSSFGQKLDESSFVLVAYSRDKKTYILPSFEEFSPRRQALTLIHEYNMRSGIKLMAGLERIYYRRGEDYRTTMADLLNEALQFDSALLKFLESSKDYKSIIEFQSRLSSLRLIDLFQNSSTMFKAKNHAFRILFAALEAGLQRPVLVSELFLDPSVLNSYRDAYFDPSLAKRFDSIIPNLASQLDGKVLEPGGDWRVDYSRGDRYRRSHDSGWSGYTSSALSEAEQAKINSDRLAMFDEQCATHGHLLTASRYREDALMHFDPASDRLYKIECGPSIADPAKIKGYAMEVYLKN